MMSKKIGREFAERLLAWFDLNGRNFPWRQETNPYKLLAVEKFLVQTDPGHVLKVYERFFQEFPTIEKLSEASETKIGQIIKPIGFWRQRAKHLKAMASAIVKEHEGTIPRSRNKLMGITGIGEYIADAYLCVAQGERRVAVDLNFRRVSRRVFYWPAEVPDDRTVADLLRSFIPTGQSKQFNWAVIDFANLICKRKPRCDICFASDLCNFYKFEISQF